MGYSGLERLVEAVEVIERAAAVSAAGSKEEEGVDGFVCPVAACGRIFSKKFNRQAHMRLHSGSRPFVCTQCSKRFMWKSSLKSHMRMHAKATDVTGVSGVPAGPRPALSKKRKVRAVTVKAASAVAAMAAQATASVPGVQPDDS